MYTLFPLSRFAQQSTLCVCVLHYADICLLQVKDEAKVQGVHKHSQSILEKKKWDTGFDVNNNKIK